MNFQNDEYNTYYTSAFVMSINNDHIYWLLTLGLRETINVIYPYIYDINGS